MQVADSYVGQDGDGKIFLRARARPMSHGAEDGWGRLVAMCLVWSGYAVNYLDPGRLRRSELRRIASELEISPELPILPDAILRANRPRRESRRD